MLPESHWYAIRVKANREWVTATSLHNKGLEVCLPVFKKEKIRARGPRIVETPLFPGYVFSRFDIRNKLPVLTTPGVVDVVGFGKRACPVDPREMEAVRVYDRSNLQIEPHSYLPSGRRVRVQAGPLRGIDGIVVEHKGASRLVVSVTLLQRSIAAEVESEWLLPLETRRLKSA